jgi:hypothetical protein
VVGVVVKPQNLLKATTLMVAHLAFVQQVASGAINHVAVKGAVLNRVPQTANLCAMTAQSADPKRSVNNI